MTSLVASRHFASAEEDLSRHLLASFTNATSPRRRTPPLRQTSSATFAYAADAPLLSLCDIFPVSSGEPTPKGKASFLPVYNFVGDVGNIFLSVNKFISPTAVIFVFKFLLFGQPRIKKDTRYIDWSQRLYAFGFASILQVSCYSFTVLYFPVLFSFVSGFCRRKTRRTFIRLRRV